jgi:hypothetical protein
MIILHIYWMRDSFPLALVTIAFLVIRDHFISFTRLPQTPGSYHAAARTVCIAALRVSIDRFYYQNDKQLPALQLHASALCADTASAMGSCATY